MRGESVYVKSSISRSAMLVFVLLPILAGVCKAEVVPMDTLIPKYVNGWRSDHHDATYDRKTLYDYIDGGAEVYLAYGFRQVFARRFVRNSKPSITADLFDMGSSADAYGIFSFEREGDDVGVGQASEYAAGFLRFWKGDFFVSILADEETPDSRKAVMALGQTIASRIKSEGERPKILALVPAEDLIRTSIRYFHEKSGLDYHYFIADKNILGLGKHTEVVLAEYKIGSSKSRLLLVRYPKAAEALAAFSDFKAAYMPEAGEDAVVRTENGKWAAARLRRNLVIAAFDAPTEEAAKTLLRRVADRTEVSEK